MILLLHPTHRKFVKLLRNKLGVDGVVILLNEDVFAILQLWRRATSSKSRHQGMYKIFIKAANRKWGDIPKDQISKFVKVDEIASYLREIELKNPTKTLCNTIIVPFINSVIKLLYRLMK